MKNEIVKVVKNKGSVSLLLPKEILKEAGVTSDNSLVMILTPQLAKLKYFKQKLMFPSSLNAINNSSSYFCSILHERDVKEFLDSIKKMELSAPLKEIVTSHFYNYSTLINKNGEITLPIQCQNYFSVGEFVCVSHKGKIEIWDKDDLLKIRNYALNLKEQKSTKINATKKKTAKTKNL